MAEHSPLQVMMIVMQHRMETQDYAGAIAVARLAAPYLHGKAPLARFSTGLAGVPDDELEDYDYCGREAVAVSGETGPGRMVQAGYGSAKLSTGQASPVGD